MLNKIKFLIAYWITHEFWGGMQYLPPFKRNYDTTWLDRLWARVLGSPLS